MRAGSGYLSSFLLQQRFQLCGFPKPGNNMPVLTAARTQVEIIGFISEVLRLKIDFEFPVDAAPAGVHPTTLDNAFPGKHTYPPVLYLKNWNHYICIL